MACHCQGKHLPGTPVGGRSEAAKHTSDSCLVSAETLSVSDACAPGKLEGQAEDPKVGYTLHTEPIMPCIAITSITCKLVHMQGRRGVKAWGLQLVCEPLLYESTLTTMVA